MTLGNLQNHNSLLERIKTEYGLGENYIQAYFQRWFETTNISEEKFTKVKNDPLLGMWFLFGLTTNQRGRLVASTFKPHIPKEAKRYLDVGCGYGGFPVAFHELGLESHGFEYDSALIPLSKANLSDYGIDPEQVQTGDVLDSEFIHRLGNFDVITCFDVLEHVDDALLCMKNMTNILNSDGLLLLKIPNKDYVSFINSDGHYNLFGITLLKHEDARKYHDLVLNDEYSVGEYYQYEYYKQHLENFGYKVHLLPPLSHQKVIIQTLAQLALTFWGAIMFWLKKSKPDFDTKAYVTSLYIKYVFTFFKKFFYAMISKNERAIFARTYMMDFWLLMAVKK